MTTLCIRDKRHKEAALGCKHHVILKLEQVKYQCQGRAGHMDSHVSALSAWLSGGEMSNELTITQRQPSVHVGVLPLTAPLHPYDIQMRLHLSEDLIQSVLCTLSDTLLSGHVWREFI